MKKLLFLMLFPLASFAQSGHSPNKHSTTVVPYDRFIEVLPANGEEKILFWGNDTLEIFNPLKVKVIKIGDEYYEFNISLQPVREPRYAGIALGYLKIADTMQSIIRRPQKVKKKINR